MTSMPRFSGFFLPALALALVGSLADAEAGTWDPTCDELAFNGYRLGMSAAEIRALRPRTSRPPGVGSRGKTISSKFTVRRPRDGWKATITLRNDVLVRLDATYRRSEPGEWVESLAESLGPPERHDAQFVFKSGRCGAAVTVEPGRRGGSRVVLERLGAHVARKFKSGR